MLPISLRPNGRRAVIVGAGEVAARKAEALLAAGYPIFVVAPAIGPGLQFLLGEGRITYAQRAYDVTDLGDAALVIAATNDRALNARVVADARARGVLVCDASDGARGDFTMPATQRIGELTINVDSGGGAPGFAARVARDVARYLGPQYGEAASNLARVREHVKDSFPAGERGKILRALAEKPVAELAAMSPTTLVCATRRSPLATVQSRAVAALLAQRGIATTMLGITTHGDAHRDRPIDELGDVNVFVKELERALHDGRADYAVHSCKDLPSTLSDDISLCAIARREDPRDAFCSERYPSFEALPAGAVLGTSSPRRREQLAALRPDLRYENIRGNVDTRLRKLADGEYDAIVLAMAGLKRLGIAAKYTAAFPADVLVPAAGQGALAVTIRAQDEWLREVIASAVNDAATQLCVECERSALRSLRAGCSAPIGVHASLRDGTMLAVLAVRSDGALVRRQAEERAETLEQAQALGRRIAQETA
ncbi:MAG: hydroxymethylbilane synthase [Candidatus Eremiobacteraeota bacterium]|nr:hydroxymethylbilane synthase [Candidatus Eremiobacteraeota bacterium]